MASLTFGYSTLADRLSNIQLPNLEKHPDWDVLITVQSGTDQLPAADQLSKAPQGEKVALLSYPGTGVTKIRNQVLNNAKGRYVIFADDDITFNESGLVQAIAHMQKTGIGLLLGQAVDQSGKLRKSYPAKVEVLNKLNSAKAATYEMIVDLEQVKAQGILFDEDFGAGAPDRIAQAVAGPPASVPGRRQGRGRHHWRWQSQTHRQDRHRRDAVFIPPGRGKPAGRGIRTGHRRRVSSCWRGLVRRDP